MKVISLILAFFAAISTVPKELPEQPERFVLVIESDEPIAEQVRLLTATGESTVSEDEYLTCVLLSEMPAAFQPEAQKAQAVAARTFLKKTEIAQKHGGAICTDANCCQAYQSIATLRQRLGDQFPSYWDKAARAVAETRGETLQYHGEYIDAVYYSCSGGRTEPAVAVWGRDVPYLKSVESPGEEFASAFSKEVSISAAQFWSAICGAKLEANREQGIGYITRTSGGGVATMQIGGVEFTGTELRRLFSLPSTNFTVTGEKNTLVFHCLGYGHRVGMSQYGAEAMAKAGHSYGEILTYYYTGVEIVPRTPLYFGEKPVKTD